MGNLESRLDADLVILNLEYAYRFTRNCAISSDIALSNHLNPKKQSFRTSDRMENLNICIAFLVMLNLEIIKSF